MNTEPGIGEIVETGKFNSLGSKLAMMAGGGAAALAGLPGTMDAAVVPALNTPISPPGSNGFNDWDVDGDSTDDFRINNYSSALASFDDLNGGRLVVPQSATSDGISKLAAGVVVGNTLAASLKFWGSAQGANTITSGGATGIDAGAGGWQVGDTGFFGFKFTRNGGADTHYGWGRLRITGTPVGSGFTILEAYYNDVPGKSIRVGEAKRPKVKIKGRKRIVTSRARVTIKGTATDDVGVEKVTAKVGSKRAKKAKGTSNWRAKVRLKHGRNKVKVVATDTSDNKSRPGKVTVIKK